MPLTMHQIHPRATHQTAGSRFKRPMAVSPSNTDFGSPSFSGWGAVTVVLLRNGIGLSPRPRLRPFALVALNRELIVRGSLAVMAHMRWLTSRNVSRVTFLPASFALEPMQSREIGNSSFRKERLVACHRGGRGNRLVSARLRAGETSQMVGWMVGRALGTTKLPYLSTMRCGLRLRGR
jgi:hypothetical protein